MKHLKRIYIASLLILCSILSYGQKTYLDSISVQIGDKLKLGMSIYDYTDLEENVENDLKILHTILEVNKDIPENVSYSIFYEPYKKLTIKQSGPAEKIIWENGKQINYQFNNQCEIHSNKYLLQIEFNELESLVSNTLVSKLKQAIDTTSTIQGRLSSTYNYSFIGESMVHNLELDKVSGQLDVLMLKGGAGANLIKNQPVIDLSAEIGLAFSQKGILKNQYYLSYNQLSDFIDNSSINLNSFINLGYRYNLSETYKDSNWLGIELGYLLSKNGDMFNKNTFRFGLNWEVGKYMTVSPQLYFSKEITYPAVRIGFGL